MTNEQRDKIAALAAEFFYKAHDLIPVSFAIEVVIERFLKLVAKREAQEAEAKR